MRSLRSPSDPSRRGFRELTGLADAKPGENGEAGVPPPRSFVVRIERGTRSALVNCLGMQWWVNERFGVALGVFVGVAALAACAGPKTYPIGCELAAVVPPTMISPANGATGVADGNFSLVLSLASPLTIELDATSGTTVTTVTLSSPVPLPSASPAQSGVSLAVPALQAATTYTVVGFDYGASGCGAARGDSYSIGTFTTR